MTQRWGATPEEWIALSLVGDLTADLLPVVSNPHAKIGESSKLKKIGKTPSRYNRVGTVGGILDWTQKQSTPDEITAWSQQPDYGISLQTRRIRAIDVDVSDADLANRIKNKLTNFALRTRSNSTKFLAAFELPGEFSKRAFKTKYGVVEFLAGGQQFVFSGTHESGTRYEWLAGTPTDFVQLTSLQFEQLWSSLVSEFSIEPSTESSGTVRHAKLQEASANDPVAQFLSSHNLILSQERDGRIHLVCPFADQHTTESSESATSYFPANTGGFVQGNFSCRHAHCVGRTQMEFLTALGIVADDFEDRTTQPATPPTPTKEKRGYVFEPAHVFAQGAGGSWIIKGVLPAADLAVVYGESSSGKSFFTLDLACHVVRGIAFRGKKTTQGAVAYIAAEGSAGFKNRLKAYAAHHEIALTDLPLTVLAASPNFMRKDNVEAVRDAILALSERPVLIIVDTLAQVTPGANENSGEDMGRALGNCKMLHVATGAMVLLIHHSGKDASKGARGWSGIGGAEDCEIEIVRDPHSPQRVAIVSKLRDGLDKLEMGFKLDVVSLGVDPDGEPITSCVVVPTDSGTSAGRARVILGDLERLTMRMLEDLIGLTGSSVKINDLLEAVVSQRVPPADGKRDTRKQVAQTALDRLVEKGQLRFNGGLVEVVHHG